MTNLFAGKDIFTWVALGCYIHQGLINHVLQCVRIYLGLISALANFYPSYDILFYKSKTLLNYFLVDRIK